MITLDIISSIIIFIAQLFELATILIIVFISIQLALIILYFYKKNKTKINFLIIGTRLQNPKMNHTDISYIDNYQNVILNKFKNLHIDFATSHHSMTSEIVELKQAVSLKESNEVLSELGDYLCYLLISMNLTGYTVSGLRTSSFIHNSVSMETIAKISTVIQKQNRPNCGEYRNTTLEEPFVILISYFYHVCNQFNFDLKHVIDQNHQKLDYRVQTNYGKQ